MDDNSTLCIDAQDGTLNASSPTTVCVGEPITVTASGGVGNPRYWVQTPPGAATWNVLENQASNSAGNGFTYTPTTPGTYRIHSRWQTDCGFCWDIPGHDWTTNNLCPGNAYVDFVVNPVANAGSIEHHGSTQYICEGSTFTSNNIIPTSTTGGNLSTVWYCGEEISPGNYGNWLRSTTPSSLNTATGGGSSLSLSNYNPQNDFPGQTKFLILRRGYTDLCGECVGGVCQDQFVFVELINGPAASSPVNPANGSTNICFAGSPVLSNLTWTSSPLATGYDVYFGTSPTPPLVSSNQVGTNYALPALSANTTYYWKIEPRNNCGVTTSSPVWSFTTQAVPCVCTPTGSTLTSTYINNFSTTNGETNIVNNSSGYSAGGYGDFTASHNVSQYRGQTINFSTGIVGGTVGSAIWVDWNQNGIFEATERVYNTTGYGSGPFTGTITVPIGALGGETRMRVNVNYNSSNPSDPCIAASTARGETEDYKFIVLEPDYQTQWLSMDFGSATWCAGETRTVSVTVRNFGSLPWEDNTSPWADFNVGVKWNADPDYLIRVDAQDLAPGQTATFTFNVTAPSTIGTDNLTFDVVKEGCFWFGGNGFNCGGRAGPGNIAYTSPQLTIQNQITLAEDRIFCATMPVDLRAESCGGTINWYESPTSCQPIASGEDYTTPPLSATTSYYVDVTSPNITSTGSYVSALANNDFFGRAGQMFDVTAATGKTIEITGVQVRPDVSGTQTVYIYYRPESHLGFHTDPSGAGWILVGQESVAMTANNLSTTINLTTPIRIPSGCTYGIYTRLDTRYRGDYTGSVNNGDITIHAGWGAASSTTPFVMASAWARGFRGNLHYNVYTVTTPRIEITAIDDCPIWLPIELLSFDALLNGNKVDLTWSTATERDNDYFTIERSKDGVNWEFVCQQSGAGYSASVLYYQDIDPSPLYGTSYYRLKQTDYNGEYTYSDLRTVHYIHENINVYPNPTTGEITVIGLNKDDKLSILDVSGKIIYDNQDEKEASMQIDLARFADGVYFIKVTNEEESIIVKVVKTQQ